MKKLAAIAIVALTVATVLTPTSAAQAQEAGLLYSVKFLCGLQTPLPGAPPKEPPVKPGNYATAVNVHNFHSFTVVIDKKAVIAAREGADQGPMSKPVRDVLKPNQAIEVDCAEIVGLFDGIPLPPFIKGFVEVVSPQRVELSVVGVYTAKECHRFAIPTAAPVPECRRFGELSLQVVPYRAPFILP